MKFMRRPDIDTVARVQIAAQAFLGLGVYGEITRIANGYRVSRLFVYKLVWQLLTLYALEVRAVSSVQALRTEVDRHILSDSTQFSGWEGQAHTDTLLM